MVSCCIVLLLYYTVIISDYLGFQTAIEVTKKELAKMKNVAFVI